MISKEGVASVYEYSMASQSAHSANMDISAS
jgi:hypothetical protein